VAIGTLDFPFQPMIDLYEVKYAHDLNVARRTIAFETNLL
jgi:hypothetical protein